MNWVDRLKQEYTEDQDATKRDLFNNLMSQFSDRIEEIIGHPIPINSAQLVNDELVVTSESVTFLFYRGKLCIQAISIHNDCKQKHWSNTIQNKSDLVDRLVHRDWEEHWNCPSNDCGPIF